MTAHYDLMAEFGIKVPDLHQAAYHTMEQDYVSLRDAQWLADSKREATVQRFKADLQQQVDSLNTEVHVCVWGGVEFGFQGRVYSTEFRVC